VPVSPVSSITGRSRKASSILQNPVIVVPVIPIGPNERTSLVDVAAIVLKLAKLPAP
jgi:hypothetical protein